MLSTPSLRDAPSTEGVGLSFNLGVRLLTLTGSCPLLIVPVSRPSTRSDRRSPQIISRMQYSGEINGRSHLTTFLFSVGVKKCQELSGKHSINQDAFFQMLNILNMPLFMHH